MNTIPHASGRSRAMTWLVFGIFFVISLVTNIIGPLIPDIIGSFRLSLTAAGLLPFAFFIAYGVMSIPAGLLIERQSEKPVMVAALAVGLAGALCFAAFPGYATAIASLFVIGIGFALLQVAINPLLRVSGGEEHYAFNSTLAQLVFGLGSFLSPLLYSYLVRDGGGFLAALVPAELPWVSVYWVFAIVLAATMVAVAAARFPHVERKDDERAGSMETHRNLLRKPLVWLYFASIFAYVGSEQGTANWISQFLSSYHGMDPQTAGASAVAWFWGSMTAGCLIGSVLLKFFDSRRVLIGSSAGAMAALTAALFGPAEVSRFAFPAIGLFASVMWPVIFSLALNSVETAHGAFAGILCTAIAGGAVAPLLIGSAGDLFGLRTGMLLLYLSFGWVLGVGFWARPLIANATVGARERS